MVAGLREEHAYPKLHIQQLIAVRRSRDNEEPEGREFESSSEDYEEEDRES